MTSEYWRQWWEEEQRQKSGQPQQPPTDDTKARAMKWSTETGFFCRNNGNQNKPLEETDFSAEILVSAKNASFGWNSLFRQLISVKNQWLKQVSFGPNSLFWPKLPMSARKMCLGRNTETRESQNTETKTIFGRIFRSKRNRNNRQKPDHFRYGSLTVHYLC